MMRKIVFVLALVVATSVAASAGSISFTGSGTNGTIDPGQAFAYDSDGLPDWGVPGVSSGLATWTGPTVTGFTITFDLPPGVSIDPMDMGTTCDGTASGGTVFCASPFGQPWDVEQLTQNSITFVAGAGGEVLTNGDPFFINIFFTGGDPTGVSFSGEWVTSPVPEPNSLLLMGSGVLGFMAVLRKYMQ